MENSPLPGTPTPLRTRTPRALRRERSPLAASPAERREPGEAREAPRRRRPPRAASRRPSLRWGFLPLLTVTLAPGCGPGAPDPTPPLPPLPQESKEGVEPVLDSIEVAGPDGPKPLVPAFASEIRHYAVRCAERETLSVAAVAAAGNDTEPATLTLNGDPLPDGGTEVSLRDDQDLAVEVRRGDLATTYAVHCVPLDFPEVTVTTRRPGPAEGLLLVDPSYDSAAGGRVSYLAVLDDHGVPRFHRRVPVRAFNFRRHAAHRLYSYANAIEDESCSIREVEVVLLDELLEVVDRVRAAGLCNTDLHDFLITPEGNFLFIAYIPAERDFSAVPDGKGEYSYSTAEPTHDSVIQEVSPEGEVVFRWNSGEGREGPPIELADCRMLSFPEQYARLNSFSLTTEGNLLASFRGCAQVLEIERPSGRVLRQVGGRAPAIPDGRVHHRFVGDPYPVGFCGQHTPIETGRSANGDLRLALFDNGVGCPGDEHRRRWHRNHPSRVVEYRLSGDEAIFLRHREIPFPVDIAGSVQALENGNWLISQGWTAPTPLLEGIRDRFERFGNTDGSRRPTSVVEMDPTGREVLAITMETPAGERALIYRAYREPGLTIPLNLP